MKHLKWNTDPKLHFPLVHYEQCARCMHPGDPCCCYPFGCALLLAMSIWDYGTPAEWVNDQAELDPLEKDNKYTCKVVPFPKTCPACGGELESQKHDDAVRSWEKCKKCGRNFVMFLGYGNFVNTSSVAVE